MVSRFLRAGLFVAFVGGMSGVFAADGMRALQGAWISVDDSKSMVAIEADVWIDYYENQEVSRTTFALFTACADNGGLADSSSSYIQTEDGLCYSIDSITPEGMELTDMDRGNKLIFKALP